MDKKGILVFLLLTFAAAYAVQVAAVFGLSVAAFRYGVVLVPAIAALVASRVSPGGDYPKPILWPLPTAPALRMALVIPLIFVFIHAITYVLGLGRPDWEVGRLLTVLPTAEELELDEATGRLLPQMYIVMGFVVSVVLGPTLLALLWLANEYGWRAYLLPRCLPLGRWRAYVVVGLLWGLMRAPEVFYNSSHRPVAHLVLHLAMAVAFGAVLGEVWSRSRHLVLTAVCCGCFMGQTYGIWPYLFPERDMAFPWGGVSGVVAIAVWGVAALMPGLLFGRLEPQTDTRQSITQ